MLVIQNRKIKKGIEIPEMQEKLSIASTLDEVNVEAIDKIKYDDWLKLSPVLIIVIDSGVAQTYPYTGDELNQPSPGGHEVFAAFVAILQAEIIN